MSGTHVQNLTNLVKPEPDLVKWCSWEWRSGCINTSSESLLPRLTPVASYDGRPRTRRSGAFGVPVSQVSRESR